MPNSQPRIICRAGSDLSSLSPVDVNRSPLSISSSHWEGSVAVRLKNYRGPSAQEGKYAAQPEQELMQEGDTWSISFEGRWKDEGLTADDVLFGNVWQKPIRDYLPYGTSAALRFVRYVDPSLDCDLYADKPWALSPLFATLQFLSAHEQSSSEPLPPFKPDHFPEDVTPLLPSSAPANLQDNPSQRRSHFAKAPARQAVPLSASHVVRGDFSHGFIDFGALAVQLPGGLSFSLEKYWNGEPVVFSCQRRGTGQQFFVVTFGLETEGKEPRREETEAKKDEGDDEANEDVD